MNAIAVIGVGQVDAQLLAELRADLAASLHVPCRVLPQTIDAGFAFHPERQQYHSTAILARLAQSSPRDGAALLAVAGVDLYIPILMFVFGEAQVAQPCAVISSFRLRQEFYGLPADKALLRCRLVKEAIHELGHTLALRHCSDFSCVMAPSHSVEWIDLKEDRFCEACRVQLRALQPSATWA
jgi:archaemetzincin